MAARQTRRWHLTDVQRLFVALTVAVALFLAFMAVGMSSGVLLVVALLLLVVVGLLVFLLGLRHSGVTPTQAEARVLSAPAAPVGKIVSACVMRLHVELPDGRSMETRHRDPSVTVTKWPRVGAVLPVEIDPRSRSLRIRWDRVAVNNLEPVTIVPRPARTEAPFYTDYVDGAESRRVATRVDAAAMARSGSAAGHHRRRAPPPWSDGPTARGPGTGTGARTGTRTGARTGARRRRRGPRAAGPGGRVRAAAAHDPAAPPVGTGGRRSAGDGTAPPA